MTSLILLGILTHLIYIIAVFESYIQSPLVHGMQGHSVRQRPPAKRLVLFVGDGLRADKLFHIQDNIARAPFLRYPILCIVTGWKENPVKFDSVFNRSTHTWSWGSPDVLPIFNKGAAKRKMTTFMYSLPFQNSVYYNGIVLDKWVIENFRKFFTQAKSNQALKRALNQEGIMLFCHLLGIDTNGHYYKPYSQQYIENIRYVDAAVRKMVNIIEDFFGHDGKTAFIFTSDHGMMDSGSHGSGRIQETYSPFIAWGAGIAWPVHPNPIDDYNDRLASEWKLLGYRRLDIKQIDIPPLMSSLLGIAIPINSMGILPISYLNASKSYIAESTIVNAKQLVAQFEMQRKNKSAGTIFHFLRHYRPLQGDTTSKWVSKLENLHKHGDFEEVIRSSKTLARLALEGINYYHTYNRAVISASVMAGLTGWIIYVLLFIVKTYTSLESSRLKLATVNKSQSKRINLVFTLFYVGVFTILIVEKSSPTYFAYFGILLFLWNRVINQHENIYNLAKYLLTSSLCSKAIFSALIAILSSELLAISFNNRRTLTLAFICLGFWPLTTSLIRKDKFLVGYWLLSCISIGIFPSLPPIEGIAKYGYVFMTGAVTGVIGIYLYIRHNRVKSSIIGFQILLAVIAIYVVNSTAKAKEDYFTIPVLNLYLSWFILGKFVQFWLQIARNCCKLLHINTVAQLKRVILRNKLYYTAIEPSNSSRTYLEHIFVINDNLTSIFFENGTPKTMKKLLDHDVENFKKLQMSHLRIAILFLLFTTTAFFGITNIGSLNSLDPAPTYCFLVVYTPLAKVILYICKISIPFVLIIAAVRSLQLSLQFSLKCIFLIMVCLTDIISMHQFLHVSDQGSWVEIGTSIAHYLIAMVVMAALILLSGLTNILLSYSPYYRKFRIDNLL
ncbi:GPI ethanolamine phosphate transferase 1 [Trichoplax sp. H2]|nr:GPI ethanolamine phosphate transferase 1 [Trichoplax sp. H2]|eukprot:RDD45993.1 GPI ethanolamine phosphate transferase 1 [Trichoplax sp. H2]